MEVILLERIEKLGAMGDVVTVKPGYGRNFLLPQEKALRATKANLARFEAEREYLEQRNEETKQKAADEGKSLEGQKVVLIRKAGDTGNLYGSVSARDIAEELADKGVKRNMVVLETPIKTLGVHDVTLRLHPEVSVGITVNVARSEDEAERQEKGEDVIALEQEEAKADAAESAAERAATAVNMFEGDAPDEFVAPETDAEPATEDTTEA
ncbi:LSU ribosomal protein L9P [Litorimonas taeanensis]|uniref:Large ribosomal subunit protein bL9 n=1 Tax=Litorimonas taeanensis TaxID=568099 RepID=A0A420WIT0_9PROT|nr:50S ribosomal protein L9 [Litorimonas taeanensis]RKQ70934.1 LSU ribosomal protein L9P [Litorimonas taeanensis]